MKEIVCPNCGKAFTIDESQFADIKSQIQKELIEEEAARREKQIKAQLEAEYKLKASQGDNKINELNAKLQAMEEAKANEIALALAKQKSEHDRKANEDDGKINALMAQIAALKKEKDSEIALALAKQQADIAKLKGELDNAKQAAELQVKEAVAKEEKKFNELSMAKTQLEGEMALKEKANQADMQKLKENYEFTLRLKEDEIARVKENKARLSTKGLGESLEQYCHDEFDKIRAIAYPRAYFEKDNDVVDHTKADFVFKNSDENGTEYLSILFEMKNENDETKTKHKNEDFLKKLDEDRAKKGCQYAVLVSMLEQDSDLYNSGIVNVSHRYPDMYVIRPQFFLPIIGLLDGASRKNAHALAVIEEERKHNLDVENFQKKLHEFQNGFSRNYNLAANHFKEAIEEIEKTIKHLQHVKNELEKSTDNLRLANDKAQDLTIKRLTKESPSLRAKFEAIESESEEK